MTQAPPAGDWPHRMLRYGGYVLHAATARPSGAFETACGFLSGPGDDKRWDDASPVTCRSCKGVLRDQGHAATAGEES